VLIKKLKKFLFGGYESRQHFFRELNKDH